MPSPFVKSRVVFKRGGSTLYDLSNIATDFDITQRLNDVDIFNFTLGTQEGADIGKFIDIDLFDDVLVYLGQDTLPVNPTEAGRVVKITAQEANPVIRTFHCKNYSEPIEREFKTKYYSAIAIHDIVNELATDLGLGTGSIGAETNVATENFDGISYKELIDRMSDYWISGSTNVKKDWRIDASKNLIWDNRPLRTSTETLVVSDTLLKPIVYYDIETVKNAIRVFGNKTRTWPDNTVVLDQWCEPVSGVIDPNWNLDAGYALALNDTCKVGSKSIYATTQTLSPPHLQFHYNLTVPTPYCGNRKDGFPILHFWVWTGGALRDSALISVSLWNAGYIFDCYLTGVTPFALDDQWHEMSIPVGPYSTYWSHLLGAPNTNWWNYPITRIYFEMFLYAGTGDVGMRVDGLWFDQGRFQNDWTTDATSISTYGRRESVTLDDKLMSDLECLNRQQSLLYMYKDPIPVLSCATPLNFNLLPGDRLTLTLPFEGITSAPFDVTEVRHIIQKNAMTQITATGLSSTRNRPPMNAIEALRKRFIAQDLLNRGVQLR